MSETVLKRKKNGRLTELDFKIYKDQVRHKDKQIDQWESSLSLKIDLYTYDQLIFRGQGNSMGKR